MAETSKNNNVMGPVTESLAPIQAEALGQAGDPVQAQAEVAVGDQGQTHEEALGSASFKLEPEIPEKTPRKKGVLLAAAAVVVCLLALVVGLNVMGAAPDGGAASSGATESATQNTSDGPGSGKTNQESSPQNADATSSDEKQTAERKKDAAGQEAGASDQGAKSDGENQASSRGEAAESSGAGQSADGGSSRGDSASGGSSGGAAASEPTPAPPAAPSTVTVHVYVDSSRAPGYGGCMASTSVTLPVGSSVYDALCACGVSVGGSSSYVSSINGLAEKLPGYPGSGWMYAVDGSYPNKACGRYTLSGGEDILWVYTLNLGNDL